MDAQDTERSTGTLTRRKVLKRAGIGAAALWTVPMISSSAAFAGIKGTCTKTAGPSPACLHLCVGGFCCGDNPDDPCAPGSAGAICGCSYTTGGDCCACVDFNSLSCNNPCKNNKGCPPGWKCMLLAPECNCDPPLPKGMKGICGAPCPNPGASASGRKGAPGVVSADLTS